MSKIKVKHLDALARSLRWSPYNEVGRYSASACIDKFGSVEIVIMDTVIRRKAFTVELNGPEWLKIHIAYHDPSNYQHTVEANVNIMRQLEGAINLMMEMGDV